MFKSLSDKLLRIQNNVFDIFDGGADEIVFGVLFPPESDDILRMFLSVNGPDCIQATLEKEHSRGLETT